MWPGRALGVRILGDRVNIFEISGFGRRLADLTAAATQACQTTRAAT